MKTVVSEAEERCQEGEESKEIQEGLSFLWSLVALKLKPADWTETEPSDTMTWFTEKALKARIEDDSDKKRKKKHSKKAMRQVIGEDSLYSIYIMHTSLPMKEHGHNLGKP